MELKEESAQNGKHGPALAKRPRKKPPQPGETTDSSKVNILLVDDTPENLIALEAVLAELDQNLIKAKSGEEALRLVLKQEFAVILLDVNLPGMNGFETASLIRERQSSEHIPIIFVSAISTSDTHLYKGYALGAVDYIFTPIIPDVLRSKVAVFVELLKKTEQMKRQAEQMRLIEEQEHRRRLSETTERLESETKRNRFFTLSIDLLAIAGFDDRFLQLNPTWEKVLGFSEAELKAGTTLDFVHPEDRLCTGEQIAKLKAGEATAYFENRYLCRDGGYRWLAWTAAPAREEQLLYLFARDVTETKRAQQKITNLNTDLAQRAGQLQAANAGLEAEISMRKSTEQALQESNGALEAFSYSVSHDLRAPLRAMQGFAKVLLEDYGSSLDAFGRDCAERIVSAAGRMDNLITDLLIYSRIAHVALELKPIQLETIVHNVVSHLSEEIRARHAEIEVQEPLPELLGHTVTLTQVLVNFLSNAIKFVGPAEKPRVRVWSETSGPMARVWIEDNGIGVPPEHHARIFRVFERLHGAEDFPGTGIGLAIVRKGLERMGGKVGLVSEPGHGSRFWFELPLASTASEAAVETARAEAVAT